jgi:hypothetical protein
LLVKLRAITKGWVWALALVWLLATAVTACTDPQPAASDLSPDGLATGIAAAPPLATAVLTPFLSPTPTPTPTTGATEAAYPVATMGMATAVVPNPYPAPGDETLYLPVVKGEEDDGTITPTPTASATATPIPTASPTPIPTIDFATVRQQLQAQGQELAYAKIGFHVGIGGNTEGLEQWMRELDGAGVPFFLKSVDNAQPLYVAQELMRESGVPHTLVYRKVTGGVFVNVPDYTLPPDEAARRNWQLHTEAFPPELDPSLVWMETMNEVDKNRSEWLAQFALVMGQLAVENGRKWAAFGWSSGEPEPTDWESPAMLQFLRFAGDHPDQIAIAVHEYSYKLDDIRDGYPYKIGRFLELFRIADKYGIPRPTILITEWGWTYEFVPEPTQAIADIAWAAGLYAPYPQVKGAAIWYLGYGDTFGDVANMTQRLITPVRIYTLTNYFAIPQPPTQAPPDPELYRP